MAARIFLGFGGFPDTELDNLAQGVIDPLGNRRSEYRLQSGSFPVVKPD